MITSLRQGNRQLIHPKSIAPNCHLPCLLGITPGKTTYAQAGRIIDAIAPQVKSDAWGPYFTDADGAEIHIQLGDSSTNLQFVTLLRVSVYSWPTQPYELTTIGELMKAGYFPVRVFRVNITGPNTVILYVVFNSDPALIAEIDGYDELLPMSPVTTLIEDRVPHPPDELMGYYDIRASEIGWYGFGSVYKYLNAPLIR